MLLWREGMALPVAAGLPDMAGVPCARTLDALGLSRGVGDPRWKAGVPRSPGTLWDAEDVRDRSLHAVYGVDPPHLRRTDPQRYLRLSRALAADLVNDRIADCRRGRRPLRTGAGAVAVRCVARQRHWPWSMYAAARSPAGMPCALRVAQCRCCWRATPPARSGSTC
ncbi:hypothetical protein ACTMU2_37380 [Cupriavidus basilensis]